MHTSRKMNGIPIQIRIGRQIQTHAKSISRRTRERKDRNSNDRARASRWRISLLCAITARRRRRSFHSPYTRAERTKLAPVKSSSRHCSSLLKSARAPSLPVDIDLCTPAPEAAVVYRLNLRGRAARRHGDAYTHDTRPRGIDIVCSSRGQVGELADGRAPRHDLRPLVRQGAGGPVQPAADAALPAPEAAAQQQDGPADDGEAEGGATRQAELQVSRRSSFFPFRSGARQSARYCNRERTLHVEFKGI